jgi:hypothetical protein
MHDALAHATATTGWISGCDLSACAGPMGARNRD